jgi:hypothetical protein
LVESGLFIPTPEHILHYCENEQYITCYHYVGKRPSEHEELSGEIRERPLKNRRLYTRIPTSEKLSVSRYSMAREADEDVIDEQAMVVDLSLGGMRIETHASLHVNQIISFAFDEHFQPPHFKGKGEIRWLHPYDPHQDAPCHAGLAFVDNETADTVRNHLLGMGEKLLRLSGS